MDIDEKDDLSEDALPLPPMPDVQTEARSVEEQANSLENTSRLPAGDGQATESQSHNVGEETYISQSFDIAHPHEYWRFNVLLAKISMKTAEIEFNLMKSLYLGKIGKSALEKCKEPTDLFKLMRNRCLLSPADVLNLQGMLWHINRHDLMQLVVEYAEETKDVIYIHAASKEPVNGYRHIKFHVSGKDFKDMSVARLNNIRSAVAGTLLIPKTFVLIDGVEPTNSIVVTFQIPEMYINILRKLMQNTSLDTSELISLGVDRITIDDEEYTLTELDMFEHEITEHQPQQMDMFKELEDTKEALSRTETDNVKLALNVAELELKLLELKAALQMREGTLKPSSSYSQTSDDTKADDRQNYYMQIKFTVPEFEQALQTFNRFLGEMSKACPDENIILNLLGSHVRVVKMHCYSQLVATIHDLKLQVLQLSSFAFQQKTKETVRRRLTHRKVEDDSIEMKTLSNISKVLTKEEEEHLQQHFGWTEAEKKEYREGSESFLTYLLHKEDEKSPFQSGVSFDGFLLTCLTEKLDRADLFVEVCKHITRHNENNRWNKRHTTETIEGKALERVSHKLTEKEKKQIEKAYNLTSDAKREDKEESIPFLIRLLREEDRKNPINGTIEVIKAIKICLTEKINRVDLFTQFGHEIQQTFPEEKLGLGENGACDLEQEKSKSDASVIQEMAIDVKMLMKRIETIERNTNLLKEPHDNIEDDYKQKVNRNQSDNKTLESLFQGIP